MILAIHIFVRMISSLRLITLPPLDRKGDGIFIKNDNLKLKLERVSPSSILDMYVVVHSRKVYFYNRGSYYGFGYDSDNVKLKLIPVPVGKVHYFTQEIADRPRPRRTRWGRVVVRDGDDPNAVKTIRTIKSISEKETLEEDSTSRVRNPSYILRSRVPDERYVEEEPKYEKVYDTGITRPKTDYNTLFKSLGEILQSYKGPAQKTADTQKDIESDSEMLDSQSLDIGIEMVDQKEKTFVLKNGRNLCVTYFQKSFIMTACAKSKRQTFKLVEAENVASRFKRPTRKSNVSVFDDIVSKEESSSSSEEKSARGFYEVANKKISEKLREKLGTGLGPKKGKKNGKSKESKKSKPKEDSETGSHTPSSTSVQPQESSAESGDANQTRSKRPNPEPSSAPGPTLPKLVPTPRRLDEYCRDMYRRSMGQVNRLPEECQVFFGFRTPAPLPAFKRTIRFPISAPRSARLSAVSKLPKNAVPKAVEETKPKSEPVPATTTEQQNINVIERLERALGTDMFFK